MDRKFPLMCFPRTREIYLVKPTPIQTPRDIYAWTRIRKKLYRRVDIIKLEETCR
jgi:hypothetical protein